MPWVTFDVMWTSTSNGNAFRSDADGGGGRSVRWHLLLKPIKQFRGKRVGMCDDAGTAGWWHLMWLLLTVYMRLAGSACTPGRFEFQKGRKKESCKQIISNLTCRKYIRTIICFSENSFHTWRGAHYININCKINIIFSNYSSKRKKREEKWKDLILIASLLS